MLVFMKLMQASHIFVRHSLAASDLRFAVLICSCLDILCNFTQVAGPVRSSQKNRADPQSYISKQVPSALEKISYEGKLAVNAILMVLTFDCFALQVYHLMKSEVIIVRAVIKFFIVKELFSFIQ